MGEKTEVPTGTAVSAGAGLVGRGDQARNSENGGGWGETRIPAGHWHPTTAAQHTQPGIAEDVGESIETTAGGGASEDRGAGGNA